MYALFAQQAAGGGADFQKQMELQQQLAGTPAGIAANIGFWGCIICSIIVIVFMFMKGSNGLGIGSIVALLACCCPGILLTFIMGWIKAGEWKLTILMLIYTVLLLVLIGAQVYLSIKGAEMAEQLKTSMLM